MSFRQFDPSRFAGQKVEYKTMKQRRALVGKRVGYDLRWSCMSHYGRVTAVTRYEICIDGNPINAASFTQVAVMDDQA